MHCGLLEFMNFEAECKYGVVRSKRGWRVLEIYGNTMEKVGTL